MVLANFFVRKTHGYDVSYFFLYLVVNFFQVEEKLSYAIVAKKMKSGRGVIKINIISTWDCFGNKL